MKKRRLMAMLLVVAMMLTLLPTAFAADDAETTLPLAGKTVILHSNDVHGAVAGYAAIAGLRTEYEAQGAEVILVDAGDYSQGTTYVSTTKGADAIDMMNAAGYDFATIGNHEFDYGYAQLAENMEKAEFQVLCADVLDADGNPIFDSNAIYTTEDGVKIGFFGLETPEAQTKANPALIKGLSFVAEQELYDCAQAQVDALKAEGADIVIALTHLGVDDESEPNRSLDLYANTDGIDMIIDGHSHTVMTEGVNGEPIQSTGTAFANVGVVIIDNETKQIEKNELIPVTDETPKDETVAAAAQVIIDRVLAEYGEVFATTEVDLNGARDPGNRTQETNLGDLITDAMLWCVQQDPDSITVDADHIVAITNGGGIRASVATGDITKNDVNTVLPFGNTVAVVYVTGAELLEALEASTYCTPTAVGAFPQIAGMEITIDTTEDYDANEDTYPGSTYYGPASIKRVTIDSVNGADFNVEDVYAVVTNNFLAAGGDTYYSFASATAQFDTGMPLDEVLMDYITTELGGVVDLVYAEPQGRITVKKAYYTDVAKSDYYFDEVQLLTQLGIIQGTGDGLFSPEENLTRGMIVTYLYRLAGEPEAEKAGSEYFTDVTADAYYDQAIGWAVETGIAKGVGDDIFAPDEDVTRQDLATFLYRYAQNVEDLGEDQLDEVPEASTATDWAQVADYAQDAVIWAVDASIIKGVSEDAMTLEPENAALRAQAAAVLGRYVTFIAAE
jgi:2',3'-cyclic-nucleotide 2'-phosphodiesterase (5'-nucleotidase family)